MKTIKNIFTRKVSTKAPAEIVVTAPDQVTTSVYVLNFKEVEAFTVPKRTVYTKKNAITK